MEKKAMTPSITDGQIDKAVDILRSVLRKHRSELGSDAVQQVLGIKELGQDLLAVFSRRVEAVSDIIIRRVTVVSRSPQAALEATGRRQYVDDDVVKVMPRGTVKKAELFFFPVRRYISDDDLEKEFELRGLRPADPFSLAAVNEADPAFSDEHPNATHWKDADGEWCWAAFSRWDDVRRVRVHRDARGWPGSWWFAGFRK